MKIKIMRKAAGIFSVAVSLALLLSGCAGDLGKLLDLDKKVTENMSIDQVNAMLTPDLKRVSILYQAENIGRSDKGWRVTSKEGGFKPGEKGAYQVLIIKPTAPGSKHYIVFFKGDATMGKSWFNSQASGVIERILQGIKLTN
ncbi:MAG: hypothetical protein Q8O43_01115 [Dehalococcoidia bacterium]|nr:hypothetical protein [Dehalococcoidia bacterium]